MGYLLTIFFTCFFFIATAQSGFQIRIKTTNIHADSLFVKSYNVKDKKFTKFLSSKFTNDITINDKTPLMAGIYVIEADSVLLSEFLISDAQNQKFTISILDEDITVEGSKENSANRAYMQKMLEFDNQLRALDMEYQQLQQSGMPTYMLQTAMDSLLKKLDKIEADKRVYQEKTIEKNSGLLLASIIQSSLELLQPPKEYYRDRNKYFSFLSEHLFDNFPWEDERLLNTPLLYNKLKIFSQQILQLDPKFAIPVILNTLNESKAKSRNMYYALFDYLEHDFGYYKSPFREETLYIAMLKDILNTPDLDEMHELRMKYYERELTLLSKNQTGEKAFNFNMLLSTGDTVAMYDIDADFLMLYFQNPDCPTCGELREKMKNMEILNIAIASGKLKIVTVYFEENEKLWRNYLQKRAVPNWIHGWNYDMQIEEEELYDFRTIPMIMFLDKNKRVIKKDLLINEIEDWVKRFL